MWSRIDQAARDWIAIPLLLLGIACSWTADALFWLAEQLKDEPRIF